MLISTILAELDFESDFLSDVMVITLKIKYGSRMHDLEILV